MRLVCRGWTLAYGFVEDTALHVDMRQLGRIEHRRVGATLNRLCDHVSEKVQAIESLCPHAGIVGAVEFKPLHGLLCSFGRSRHGE